VLGLIKIEKGGGEMQGYWIRKHGKVEFQKPTRMSEAPKFFKNGKWVTSKMATRPKSLKEVIIK